MSFFTVIDRLVQFLALFNVSIEGVDEIGTTVSDLGFVWQSLDLSAGGNRRFMEYQPDSLAEDNAALVITFHGLMGAPENDYEPGFATFGALLDFADEKGFLLVAPEASKSILQFRAWNDYGRFYLQPGGGADDVVFTEAIIDWAVNERGVDPSRVFVAGVSGGGSLVYRLLNERSGLFAAASVLASSLLEERRVPQPTNYVPTPFLSTIGTRDPFFRFNGGSTSVFDTRSMDATLAYFSELNGLSVRKDSVAVDEDRCRINKVEYESGTAPVVSYYVDGGGHLTPGTDLLSFYTLPIRIRFGPLLCLHEFSFIPTMIDFFERFGL